MIARAQTRGATRMLARRASALVVAAVCLFGPIASVSAAERPSTPPVRTVVLILAPYLSWNDITAEKTPAIWGLIGEAALGNVNAHTAEYGEQPYSAGVLTLSASRWATGPTTGPLDAASLERARSANAGVLSAPTLGGLGTALRSTGVRTVAIGASDTSTRSAAGRLRMAELLAADARGHLDASTPDVLVADASAPFGLRTDAAQVGDAVRDAASGLDRQLVVIDAGDLSRAHDASGAPQATRERWHDDAVRALDAIVGQVEDAMEPQSGRYILAIVPAVTTKAWYRAPELGPLVVAGPGFRGELVSASTRRDALATNLDIAPTVLASLGATVPAEMLGKPLESRATDSDTAELVARLARDGTSPGVIDRLRDAWAVTLFCIAAIAGTALATAYGYAPRAWLAPLGEGVLTFVLSAMPAAWLMFLLGRQPLDTPSAALAFGAATLVVALAVLGARRVFSASRIAGSLLLTGLSTLVILADQWSGRPIESGIFSYSITSGWRYYGMGNEGAAIVVGASIACVALAVDALGGRPALAAAVRRFGIPVVGLVTLVTAAAPFAGANVGVAVWGVIAYGIAWAAMNGVRLTWRTAGVTLGVAAVAVAAFSAVDLMRASGSESHLARFVRGILRGDLAATGELIWRKLRNNLNYLPQTIYTALTFAVASALALLRFSASRPLVRALKPTPVYARALLGIAVGGVVAWLTEDSGIVMPALMLLAGGAPALLLLLHTDPAEK